MFSIKHKNQKFYLENSSLSPEKKNYLEDYLSQVSRYKIIGHHDGHPVLSLYQPPLTSQAGHRSLLMRLSRRFENTRLPATATIAVNKACQCECSHCSAVFYNHSQNRDLDSEKLKQALQETTELGVTTIILLGGEPLLRKDLIEQITNVDKTRSMIVLFTNGEYLSVDYCNKLKNAGLLGAFVSLDCSDPKAHDLLRKRPGLFDKAIKGIANLKSAGLVAGISSYLSPDRLAQGGFEEMMELGKKTEAQEVTFFDAIPSGRWLKDTSCLLRTEDRQKISLLTKKYREKNDYPGLSVQSTMTSECGSAFCFAANTQFYLTAWGEMCPCDFTPLSIGHFPDEPIATLWKKMISIEPYAQRAKSCRMQDVSFRKKYIDPIPPEGPYPYPLTSVVDSLLP